MQYEECSEMSKEEKIGGFERYQIESAFDTLTRAKEILKDKKKVAAIKIYAKKHAAAIAEVTAQLNMEKNTEKKLSELFKE